MNAKNKHNFTIYTGHEVWHHSPWFKSTYTLCLRLRLRANGLNFFFCKINLPTFKKHLISKVTKCIIIKYFFYFFFVKSRDRIDRFIDENKALMKRMYGDFEMMENGPFPKARKRRQDSSFSDNQSKPNKLPTRGQPADSGRY